MAFNRRFYIYILASKSRRLNVGITNSLVRRVLQHKAEEVEFTRRYNINRLVYYEQFKYVNNCIARETQLKKWSRAKKIVDHPVQSNVGRFVCGLGQASRFVRTEEVEKQIPHR